MRPDDLVELLERCDPDRIEIHGHAQERARRRNVDIQRAQKEIEDRNIVSVRQNHQSDPKFAYSYIVTVAVGGQLCEMPVYFNVPGTKLLIKSIWPR